MILDLLIPMLFLVIIAAPSLLARRSAKDAETAAACAIPAAPSAP